MPDSHATAANVHLSAIEHKDSIVFLHAVQAGPASQSYGLQVAQLAGVPQTVIKAARKHLARLEAHAHDAGGQRDGQRDLFSIASADQDRLQEENSAAENAKLEARQQAWQQLTGALDEIDPDALSPREALEQLYQLKRLAALAPA